MTTLKRCYQIIIWMEPWIIIAAVLCGMLWTAALISAPVISLFYLILRFIIEKKFPGSTPADTAIFLLLLILSINFLMSSLTDRASPAVLRLIGGIALYYSVAHWCRTSARLRTLVTITGLALLGLSVFSLIAVDWTSGKLFFIPVTVYERFSLLVADTVHPNVMAGSLIALLPLIMAVSLFGQKKNRWIEKIINWVALIFALMALLLTQSRSAIIALSTASLILLLLRSSWFWSLPILGLVSVAVVAIKLGITNLLPRFTYVTTELLDVRGIGSRTDIWQRTIFMLQDFPLTGVGMGQFTDAFRIFYPISLNREYDMPHAHNIFLQVSADLGLPGVITWLSILIATSVSAYVIYRRSQRQQQMWLKAIGAGIFCSQLAIIFHGFMDSVLWGEIRSVPIVWWLWGLTMAALNVSNRQATLVQDQSVRPVSSFHHDELT